MPSAPTIQRRERERSLTWPPLKYVGTDQFVTTYKGQPKSASMPATQQTERTNDAFQAELENHPEDHFLSPIQMYEYEDWADDSDDDAEEVEWDAGITDFALFDNDRRFAQESNEPVQGKWSSMLAQQASAFQRAVERTHASSIHDSANRLLSACEDDMPHLTPDASPDLSDDLDVEPPSSRPSVPSYLTMIVTPAEEDDDVAIQEDEDLPLSLHVPRKQFRAPRNRRLERPGLRHSRTLSGRVHTWRRPGFNIYTVGEEPDAESRAEMCASDGTREEERSRE